MSNSPHPPRKKKLQSLKGREEYRNKASSKNRPGKEACIKTENMKQNELCGCSTLPIISQTWDTISCKRIQSFFKNFYYKI